MSSLVELGTDGTAREENGDTHPSTLLRCMDARSLRGVVLDGETVESHVCVVWSEESGEVVKKKMTTLGDFSIPSLKSEKVNDQTYVCFFTFFILRIE